MGENGARSDLKITLHDGRELVFDRYALTYPEIMAVEKTREERDRLARHHDHLAEALKADPGNLGLIQAVEKAEEDWSAAFDAAKRANDEKVAKMVELSLEELTALPWVEYQQIQEMALQVLRRERGADPN